MQFDVAHLKVLLGSDDHVQAAGAHVVPVGRQLVDTVKNDLCGELQDVGRFLHLLHAHSDVHQPLEPPHQAGQGVVQNGRAADHRLLEFVLGAVEHRLDVAQRVPHGFGLQLGDGGPEAGDQAEQLLRGEALIPEEVQTVPPPLSRPQQDARVLAQKLLQPNLHVVLIAAQVQVGLPQRVDDLLVALHGSTEAVRGARHQLADDPIAEVKALEVEDVGPLVAVVR